MVSTSSTSSAGQLEHSLHVADVRMALAKSPADKSHWAGIHCRLTELDAESGYQWKGGRLTDPEVEEAKAKSLAKSLGVKAAEFQSIRGEVMAAIARARSEADSKSLRELYSIRDQRNSQAKSAGLKLGDRRQLVAAWG